MRRLLLALALLALAGSAWALDQVGGNTWEKGLYVSYGRVLFTAGAQESTIYFFQGPGDSTNCSPDSMRWSYICQQRIATTQPFYATAKLRRMQHVELWPNGGSMDLQVTFYTGGSIRSQRVYLDAFLPGRVFHTLCDSLRIRTLTSSNGSFLVNYTIW